MFIKNKVLKKTKKLFIDYPKTALRAISLIVKKMVVIFMDFLMGLGYVTH